MISPTVLKIGLSLAAVFGCGGVCGYAVAARQWMNPAARAHLEDRWIESRRREDARKLHLTAEQNERLRPAYQQLLAEVRGLREEATRSIAGAVLRETLAVQAELTPEQKGDFARLIEERRTNRQKTSTP